MRVEVPCPQCGAVLKAPAGSEGRKARCKKCRHGFRLPGAADDAVGQESVQLSVADAPAFSFDATAANAPKETRPKYQSSIAGGGTAPAKRSRKPLLIGAAVALIAGGVAAAVILTSKAKPVETASAAPAKEKPADPEKAKEPIKKPVAKAEPKAAVAKAQSEVKPKAVALTGGLKLPAAPANADKLHNPTAAVSVDLDFAKVRRVFVSGGDSPLATIVSAGDAGFQGLGAKDFVDRYNLGGGTRIDRTEIAADQPWPRACDVSPNGDLFIAESPAGKLTLYDLNAKTKLGDGFTAFASEEIKTPAPLAAAYFIQDTTVAAVAKDGRVELWDVKESKTLKSGAFGAGFSRATLKPDRSSLFAVAGANVLQMPMNDLVPKPVLTLPNGGGDGLALAVDNADRLAVAFRATAPGPHNRLIVARTGDAKPSANIHFDDALGVPTAIDWCAPEAFTVTFEKTPAALVYETEVSRPLAVLWPQGNRAMHTLAGGKHYVLMPNASKCMLLVVDFPPDDFLPLRNEALEAKAPISFLLTLDGYGR